MRQARRVLREARAQVLAGTVLGIGCRAGGSVGLGALLERPAVVAGWTEESLHNKVSTAAALGEGSLRRFKTGARRAGDVCDAAVAPDGAGQGSLGNLQWIRSGTGLTRWSAPSGGCAGSLVVALDIVRRCGEGRLLHQRRGERGLARG